MSGSRSTSEGSGSDSSDSEDEEKLCIDGFYETVEQLRGKADVIDHNIASDELRYHFCPKRKRHSFFFLDGVKFEKTEELGRGYFGAVVNFVGIKNQQKEERAVKRPLDSMPIINFILKEMVLFSKAYPDLAPPILVKVVKGYRAIMPKVKGQSLNTLDFKPEQGLIILRKASDELYRLHKLDIVHRDFLSKNLMVEMDEANQEILTVRAVDFGQALWRNECEYGMKEDVQHFCLLINEIKKKVPDVSKLEEWAKWEKVRTTLIKLEREIQPSFSLAKCINDIFGDEIIDPNPIENKKPCVHMTEAVPFPAKLGR